MIRRNALSIALGGRNEDTLVPILEFLVKNITDRRWSATVIQVTNAILGIFDLLQHHKILIFNFLDIYGQVIGQSPTVDGLLFKLQKKLQQEVRFQQQLHELLGSL